MATSERVGRSGRATPGGILFLANAVAGLVLLVDEVLRWTPGPAPDLPAIARMATFLGILALGITQFMDSGYGGDTERGYGVRGDTECGQISCMKEPRQAGSQHSAERSRRPKP